MYMAHHPHWDLLKAMTQPLPFWMCSLRYIGVHPASPSQQPPSSVLKGRQSKTLFQISLNEPFSSIAFTEEHGENTEQPQSLPEQRLPLHLAPRQGRRKEKMMVSTHIHIWAAFQGQVWVSDSNRKHPSYPQNQYFFLETFCHVSSYRNGQIISTCSWGKSLGKLKILAQGQAANAWQGREEGSKMLNG